MSVSAPLVAPIYFATYIIAVFFILMNMMISIIIMGFEQAKSEQASKQNLYGQSTEETLGAEVTFRLYHNCRNTVQLNAATNEICSAEVKPMPGMPRGKIPQVIICKSEHMADKAWSLVHELSPDGGAVILSPYTLKKSCMSNSPKAYGLTLTENLREIGLPGFVFFSTIKSFKGLEAPHVVLVHADKPNASQALAEEDLYVALKSLKSGKCRDPEGLIRELFKEEVRGDNLKESMLILHNKIKQTMNIAAK